jgi:serine/threonine protein kinase
MAVGMTGRLLADRYRTIRRIGSGGMATVFLAKDCTLGRNVAVKRLHGDVSDDDLVRRFQREARVGASLNHPNIVAVYDIAVDDEGILIVMEYVEGETLRDEIAEAPLAPERALPVLRGVAEALDHAHGLGVLHRDVKPANVLLRKDGAVKLADLGIATAAEHSRITRSGAVLGTAAYMAPERLEGEPGESAADIYALAAVAFEALSGRKAVEGSTPLEIAQRVVNQPPADLSALVPDAPPAAAAALKRGLAKDPAERPPSARELVTELERAYAEAPKPAPAPPAKKAPTRPATPAVAVDRNYYGQQQPRSRRPSSLPILGGIVLLALVALIAILATGDDGGTKHQKASKSTPAKAAKKRKHSGGGVAAAAAPAASAPAPAAQAAPASTSAPSQTVNAFYQHAAKHDYASAWSMLTEAGRSQLGGERSFAAGQSTLRSISFPVLRTTSQTADSATVELQSSAIHTTRTDHVCGTVDLVRSGTAWLLDAFHLDTCSAAQLYPGGRRRGHFPTSPKPSDARGDPGAEGGD